MALEKVTTSPVVAKCYIYQSADTVGPVLTAEDPDFPLADILDPNLQRVGRTTSGGAASGYVVTLDAAIPDLVCVEVVNFAGSDALPAGALIRVLGQDSGASTTFNTAADELFLDSDVYTAQVFMSDALVRPNWIKGFDNLQNTAVDPPALVEVEVKTMQVETRTPGAGIGFVETGFLALGFGAVELAGVNLEQINVSQIELFEGRGYRWAINWPRMKKTEVVYLEQLWQHTLGGTYPCFFFPAAGTKTSTGTLAKTWNSPHMRGGLVRLLSVGAAGYQLAGKDYVANVTLTVESWQEVPANA